jgi:hypothetical protein
VVAVTNPPNNAVLQSDTVTVVGTVTENAADDAGFPRGVLGPALGWTLDGSVQPEIDVSCSGTFSFNVQVTPGFHTICLQATDLASNLSAPVYLDFSYDPAQLVFTHDGIPFNDGDAVDLGVLPQGPLPLCGSFVVQNTGGLSAAINCPPLSSPFEFEMCPPTPLDGGASGTFDICMAADISGSFSQMVTFPIVPGQETFTFTLVGMVEPADPFIRGDCETNGSLNITDAILILYYVFQGNPTPDCLDACDSNNDSLHNIADAITVLSYLYSGGIAPPPPFLNCGFDQDEGTPGCEVYTCP